MSGFISRTLVNALAIAGAAALIPGLSFGNYAYKLGLPDWHISLVLTAAALGIVNATIRPFVKVLALPLQMITFGTFTFVINAVLLIVLAHAVPQLGFAVDTLLSAFLAAVVISVVSSILSLFIRT